MGTTHKNRVLIGKPGLDGHDRGAKFIAQALRDAGFEVVYTGIRRSPEEIAAAAVQEDVHAVGLSSLSGAHMRLFPAVVEALAKAGAPEIPVLGGGVIPDDDIVALKEAGIRYRNGLNDYLPVLTQVLTVQDLERDLIRQRANLLSARVGLYRALGGTWPDNLSPSANADPGTERRN